MTMPRKSKDTDAELEIELEPEYMTIAAGEARKALRWFQGWLGLQDWQIVVTITDSPPAWWDDGRTSVLGAWNGARTYKNGEIWMCPATHATHKADMLSTLFHECCHIMGDDIGISDAGRAEPAEFCWNRLGDLLAMAYRRGVK